MNTPYFISGVSQETKDSHRPYGPNRAEVDAAAMAIISERILRELNTDRRGLEVVVIREIIPQTVTVK